MWRGSWKRSLKNEPSLWKNIKFYSLCMKFLEVFQKIFFRTLHLWLASVFLIDFRNWALRFFNSKNFFQILLDLIIPWCISWCMYYSKYILLKKIIFHACYCWYHQVFLNNYISTRNHMFNGKIWDNFTEFTFLKFSPNFTNKRDCWLITCDKLSISIQG